MKSNLEEKFSMFFFQDQVTNSSQCHYLTRSKTYLIFLDSMTTMEPEIVTIYRLDDREEIEINENLPKKFLEENCQKKNHYGNSLTIFYADQTNQCKRMTITCNGSSIDFFSIETNCFSF